MSRWVAESILQRARDRAVCVGPFRWSPPVGAITGAFFPRRPGIQIAALWGGTGGVESRGFLAMAIAARGVLDHLRRIASHNTDKQVRGWRKHWERGADARWSGASNGVNPYPWNSYRASAWSAGWRWAEHRADRRKPHATRLAHPYRRNSDTLIRLVRRTNAGAVGVSALTIVAAILEIRRRRARAK